MKPLNNKLMATLISLLCSGIAILILDYQTTWPTLIKLLAMVGIFGIIFFLSVKIYHPKEKESAEKTEKPAEPAPPRTSPPPTKKVTPQFTTFSGDMLRLVIGLALIGGLIYGIGWQFIPWLNNWSRQEASKPIERKLISPGPIVGHDWPIHPKKTFKKRLKADTIYDAFELELGQQWKWDYFEAPLEFRVMLTGDEAFTPVSKSTIGQKWYAQQRGTLQVRSHSHGNLVRLLQLQTYER